MDLSIFKPCDIRGRVGSQWNTDDARHIGYGLGVLIRRRGRRRICVGGDFRESTLPLKAALVQGLVDSGMHVIDVGQMPTPAVYFAAHHFGCVNAAIVTASHNPPEYNGLKFLIDGRPPRPALVEELKDALSSNDRRSSQGRLLHESVERLYEDQVLRCARHLAQWPEVAGKIASHPMRVLLDTMAGAATEIAPRLLGQAGFSAQSMELRIAPDFHGRVPNPAVDANLEPLVERLRAGIGDIGVALDGDGDRVIFVMADGTIVRPEQIAALLIRHCFNESTVVYDLKCASLVRQTAAAFHGRSFMQPSGHGFIKAAMIDVVADLGVEVSGHHFFHALHGGDDGLVTALLVLFLCAKHGKSLRDLIAPFTWPAITPDLRIPWPANTQSLVDRIAATWGERAVRLDGVRVEYPGGWALARPSITEPAITLRFEGRSADHVRQLACRFLQGEPELLKQVQQLIDRWADRLASL